VNLRIISKFILRPQCSVLNDVRSGEVLLDQERFQDAIEKFERAIELEKNKLVLISGFRQSLNIK
jgi:hypothetical protein